ncbi:hypothetical protein FACS189413_18470 [Bacteroidia bacterium]|nr:hypothetical protein FACS189413_18470 [Bacteroidia bacterium]
MKKIVLNPDDRNVISRQHLSKIMGGEGPQYSNYAESTYVNHGTSKTGNRGLE